MNRPQVGIALIVRKNGKILLQRRKSKHGNGLWGAPGGHLELWESFEDAASRELWEEAGDMDITKPEYFYTANTMFKKEGKHYVVIFMVCDWIAGEPKIMEPDKTYEWKWHDWNNLPQKIMPGYQQIKNDGFNPF